MTRPPAWQPSRLQTLLLHACLDSDPNSARRHFGEWQRQLDLDHIDFGSYRLLPLLWKRIEALAFDSRDRERIKGVYRRTWYANQLVLARASLLVQSLAARQIPTMVIKGAPLALCDYGDPGQRPMDDVDLVVPFAKAHQAVDALCDAGWVPEPTPLTGTRVAAAGAHDSWTAGPRRRELFDDAYFHARHAHGFRGPGGTGADLHWVFSQENFDPRLDQDVGNRAIPLRERAGGTRWAHTLVPSPADHLLLLLVHGSRWNPVPPVRWAADSVILLRSAGTDLDWTQFEHSARDRGQAATAAVLLAYLEREFSCGIPAEVLRRLAAVPVSAAQRRNAELSMNPPGISAGLAELSLLYQRYRSLRRAGGRTPAGGFPGYLRHVLGAPSLWALTRYVGQELGRRWTGVGVAARTTTP
ncbi:MAG: nucleotidyltransferase family protein [Planctomycetaceae bacterium]